ncbi:MAG: sulfatase-like hydrolase/transferase [Acidobacteriota bacterium]
MKITRRKFVKSMGASAITLSGGLGFVNCNIFKKRKPNIVVIFIDDMGYADVGCYGALGFETPNLDRMAAEGMRFTNFYVSQAVCSASRASLLTGCYSERVGIQGALMPWSNHGLDPGEETIADILKTSGYATGIFGKWHLGHHKEFLPGKQGFDEYFGLPYSNDMWPVSYVGEPLTSGSKSFYPPLPLIESEEEVGRINTINDQGTLTTMYTERSVQFIRKNKKRPFFLYVPHSMPHVPLGVSDKFKGKSKQGMYGDVIMEIDWSVGEILKSLKENELDDNTLVIFTSDNGPALNFGDHGGSALPLREGKGTMWEGGARVPCIMRWPGKIKAGSECNKIAASIDILPTLAAISGAELPERVIDGINILPLIKSEPEADPRDHYFYYYGGGLRAVRQGRWKLYFPHITQSFAGVEPGKNGLPGPTTILKVKKELYDLENDIGEKYNVIDLHPDVVQQLEMLADRARIELGDRLTHTVGTGVRKPGRIGSESRKEVKHLAIGTKITLKNSYSPLYTGGSKNALINGIRGTIDHLDGQWQGFEKVDLDAVIDLGEQKSVKKINCSFLNSQSSWIFLPKKLEIAISDDGINFKQIKSFEELVKIRPKPEIIDYIAEIPARFVRFIRIKAVNTGICPKWHPGAGGKAWLFVDEIIVE